MRRIYKNEEESLKLLEKHEEVLTEAMKENKILIQQTLEEPSSDEMLLKLEIENLSQKMENLDCKLKMVFFFNDLLIYLLLCKISRLNRRVEESLLLLCLFQPLN